MKTLIFLQARFNSTRLPGKILTPILGKSVFELTVERLKKVQGIQGIVVVTGPQERNGELVKEAERLDIPFFCGSEDNLLDRFYQASQVFLPNVICRATGDCPLIDPNVIEQGLRLFEEKGCDILTNARVRTFPDGLDFELFTRSALEQTWAKNEGRGKNAITPLLENEDLKAEDMVRTPSLGHIRITLDYPEDLAVIKEIYENLYKENSHFSLEDIMRFLFKQPSLLNINKKHNLYL